jgi:hypothetical protein
MLGPRKGTRVNAAARSLAVLALAAALHAASLAAQDPFGDPPRPNFSTGDRISVGLTFAVAIPRGDFDQFAGTGLELNAHLLFVNRDGWLGLRVSGAGAFYQAIGQGVAGIGNLRLSNRTGTLDVGPQVTLPWGPVRPYGFASVGGTYIRTDPSITGLTNPLTQEDPVYNDVTHAFAVGGGVYVPLTTGDRSISLDFGARYRWNGRTRFLESNGITLVSPGRVTLNPTRVSPRLLILSLGVAVGL